MIEADKFNDALASATKAFHAYGPLVDAVHRLSCAVKMIDGAPGHLPPNVLGELKAAKAHGDNLLRYLGEKKQEPRTRLKAHLGNSLPPITAPGSAASKVKLFPGGAG